MGKIINRIGEKYITNEGYVVEVVEFFSYNDCTVLFEDGTVIKNRQFGDVKRGEVRNYYHPSVHGVGYVGIGDYKTSKINGKQVGIYQSWRDLIKRGYCVDYKLKKPTYKNCSVHPDWHCYQNFAAWYEENYIEGWHLDKDILLKGNKIYSPETCCFVPQEINSLFTQRTHRGSYPVGVHINKKGRFIAQTSMNGQAKFIGVFDTPEEAFYAYKTAKEKYIKEVADRWKGQILPKVHEAMYNYLVEITD